MFEKIEKFCKEKGISINKFEDECGFGNGTVSKWRGGKVKPSMNSIERIAEYTKIPVGELFS